MKPTPATLKLANLSLQIAVRAQIALVHRRHRWDEAVVWQHTIRGALGL